MRLKQRADQPPTISTNQRRALINLRNAVRNSAGIAKTAHDQTLLNYDLLASLEDDNSNQVFPQERIDDIVKMTSQYREYMEFVAVSLTELTKE